MTLVLENTAAPVPSLGENEDFGHRGSHQRPAYQGEHAAKRRWSLESGGSVTAVVDLVKPTGSSHNLPTYDPDGWPPQSPRRR